MKKVLYIFDAADWQSRIPVAHEALSRGLDVTLGVIGSGQPAHDFKMIQLRKPSGTFSVLSMIYELHTLVRRENPDMVHTVTLKYAFVCAIASLGRGHMKKIYTIAGLGYLFHAAGLKAKILRCILLPFMKFLFRQRGTHLIFQNADDKQELLRNECVNTKQCHIIRGSGVDLSCYAPDIASENPPLVLMPTRLVQEKGVGIFIEAARLAKAQYPSAIFQIAGGETTHNPRAITAQQMHTMTADGTVEWLGRVEDMPNLLARASLIVYPSYYGEGIPRVLLEACAAGRAIITTDHTGCREAVAHMQNGLLVPIKNPQATAEAILTLLHNENLRISMGRAGRQRAEKEFDIRHIAAKTVDVYSA